MVGLAVEKGQPFYLNLTNVSNLLTPSHLNEVKNTDEHIMKYSRDKVYLSLGKSIIFIKTYVALFHVFIPTHAFISMR